MTFQAGFRGWLRDKAVVRVAQLGTLLLATLCWNCGTGDGGPGAFSGSGGALDPDRGGSATGGSGRAGGEDSSGGDGGEASGGSGAAASGGDGNASEVKACPGAPTGGTCRKGWECGPNYSCRPEPRDPSLTVCGPICTTPPPECAGDSCGDGMVCVVAPHVECDCATRYHCVPSCTPDSCGEGYVCGTLGQCVPGSCVADGYVCPADALCDPERTADPTGCVPRSCDGDGYECPDYLICDVDAPGDPHGCRTRLCDEGFSCSEGRVCDPGAEGLDSRGCRESSCATDGYECPEGSVCDPSVVKGNHQCRQLRCNEGVECSLNSDCDENGACIPRPCTNDTDCDCGACVFDRCASHAYFCVYEPA